MIQEKIYSYFAGNEELRVLFVFDWNGAITTELEGMEWKEGYRMEVFKGDWFTTKYKMANEWKDEKIILIVPGRKRPTEQKDMAEFPLYGEMKANMVYSEEDYVTFMQLKGIKSDFAPYILRHIAELQLTKYEKILAESYDPKVFSIDICNRALVTGYLGGTKLMDWTDIIIKIMCLCGNEKETGRFETFSRALRNNNDAQKALAEQMRGVAGEELDLMTGERIKRFAESLKYNAITQGIPAIAADDYRGYKIEDAVMLQRLNSLMDRASRVEQFGEALGKLAAAIKEESIIRWYGADAEYSYFNEEMSYPIIKREMEERAFAEPVETNERMRLIAIRLPIESPLQKVIDFVANVCCMLEKIQTFGSYKLKSAKEYVDRYAKEFYVVDTYYRKAIGCYREIESVMPIYESVQEFKRRMDGEYAKQCNMLNQEWIRCVNESGVKLAKMEGIGHQQNFYEERLRGVDAKRVVIVSDALRYEVAAELMNALGDSKHSVQIEPALAVLPTETKYSKLTLLPHKELQYRDGGLKVDGETLKDVDERSEHIKKYEANALCVDYKELETMTQTEKREMFKRPLVYIFHDTIDSISHDNPTKTADACEAAITELKKLIPSLHATYNVVNVYVVSDHGFLYNDMEFAEKDKHKIDDEYDERKSRYYITSDEKPVYGITKYAMSDVSTMKNEGRYLAVPDGTNRLNAEGGGYQFTHGGASLQEIVIPVIYSHRMREDNKEKVGMTLIGSGLSVVSSRLKFSIVQDQAVSEEYKERRIVCGIYEGANLLTAEKEIVLNSADVNPQNRFQQIELVLIKPTNGGLMELRIYDKEDKLNPMAKATVANKTLIERDF